MGRNWWSSSEPPSGSLTLLAALMGEEWIEVVQVPGAAIALSVETGDYPLRGRHADAALVPRSSRHRTDDTMITERSYRADEESAPSPGSMTLFGAAPSPDR